MHLTWLKGHGTENDFVLLPDHDGQVLGHLAPELVTALCDRHRGLGADGILRGVRTDAIEVDPALDLTGAEWVMDYRNADGSVSEMCGNGVRVFARHLLEAGLGDTAAPVRVGTRDGVKVVTAAGDDLRVDMGPFVVGDVSEITVGDHAWKARGSSNPFTKRCAIA